jgi:UPF0716 family protein affecting phage T7 exclusion
MYKMLCFALLLWCFIAVTSMLGVQALLQFMVLTTAFFLLVRAHKIKKGKE